MRFAIVSLLLLSLCSCSDKKKIPSDVMPKDKMERVLWDVVQAERFHSNYILKDSLKKDVKKERFILYDQVFQLHKTNKQEFTRSYKFYLTRPDISKIMFDSINARAARLREQQYQSPQKPS